MTGESKSDFTSAKRSGANPLALALLLAGVSLGCGGSGSYGLAPVSGVVTLDGAPVAQAEVVFQPVGGEDNPTPGPSSMSRADAEGRYQLTTIRNEPGAVVGKHRIVITTPRPPQAGDSDSGFTAPVHKEVIPARYNNDTQLTFEVPAGGTNEANFELTSDP